MTYYFSQPSLVTCQATDTRIVIEKWISHLHSYRWVCEELFYMVFFNAVTFFFSWIYLYLRIWGYFSAPGCESTHQQCPKI